MREDKPVPVQRERYPELAYPRTITPASVSLNEVGSIHLLEYWRIIFTHRWTVLAVLLTVVAGTLIWTLKATPVYRAQVSLQIDRENQNILSFKDIYEIDGSADDTLRTQFEVLKSRSLARRVIQDLHLDKVAEFQETSIVSASLKPIRDLFASTARSKEDADPLRPIIDEYLDRLSVAPVRQARLATVSFESKDPKLAAQIINAHANTFIDLNFQYKWEATQKASAFLKTQSDSLKGNLEKAEDRLQAYSRENQILFTEQGRNTATEKLQQLEEEYTKAVADRIQKESFNTLILNGNTDALPSANNNQLLAGLTIQLAELQREESELAVTFSADYPSRKRKRSQIEQIEKAITTERERIVRTVQAEYLAAKDREAAVSAAVIQQRNVVNKLNEVIIQYNIIKREVDSERQLYDSLLTRLNEAGVSADLRASNIRIVDSAETPEKPVRPRKALNLALSLVFGLLSGVGLALFQEYIDDTIKSAEDIGAFLKVPTLGLVPKMASLKGKRNYAYAQLYGASHQKGENAVASSEPRIDIIAHEAPSSLMAEAYRSIRTSLLLSSPDHPPRSVLISSAAPSEGKTVTAINLAISLTQTGARVALIDADMRKPRASSTFGMKEAIGLSAVLTGTTSLKEAIQQTNIANLFVIPCGAIPPNPGELIVADSFRQVMQVLPHYFDYVILDSPPMSSVSDGRVLAAMCDATILVVKALGTSRHQAVNALDHLRASRSRLAGVVLNDVDVRAAGTYYSAYYSRYAYSYSEPTQRKI